MGTAKYGVLIGIVALLLMLSSWIFSICWHETVVYIFPSVPDLDIWRSFALLLMVGIVGYQFRGHTLK